MITVNAAWNIWNFRRALVSSLIADGHTVSILAPPDESVSDLIELGCRFLPLEMNVQGLNPAQDILLLHRLWSSFIRERPDVVLSFTIKNNIFGAFAARLAGIPFLPTVTGLGTAFLSGGMLETVVGGLYRNAFSHLSSVFFQNGDDLTLFLDRGLVKRDAAHSLPGSGIDLSHFRATELPPTDTGPVFLMIGRLLRDKGVVEYVEAARRVKAQAPEAKFQLLGALGAKNRSAICPSALRDWIADGTVEYLGTTSDVRPYIAAAHCIVLPSYREGAPRTLIEAAAMARPVIATDVPGSRSVVDHCKTGFLCAARDANSLSQTIFHFLELQSSDLAKLGAAGRAKMEREFDQAIILKKYKEEIRALL